MRYLRYKQMLKEAPPINDPYLDAILRVIIDFEYRVETNQVLMLGIMDIEKLIRLYELCKNDSTLGWLWRKL